MRTAAELSTFNVGWAIQHLMLLESITIDKEFEEKFNKEHNHLQISALGIVRKARSKTYKQFCMSGLTVFEQNELLVWQNILVKGKFSVQFVQALAKKRVRYLKEYSYVYKTNDPAMIALRSNVV